MRATTLFPLLASFSIVCALAETSDVAFGQAIRFNDSPAAVIQQRAVAARTDDPTAVRALVDEIFNQSLVKAAADSIRSRVARAELQFRTTGSPTVGEHQLVAAINARIGRFGGPRFAMTTVSQVQVIRGARRRTVPGLKEPGERHEGGPSLVMSPAEAVFVTLMLATNKAVNPRFQVDPESFDSQPINNAAPATPSVSQGQLHSHVLNQDMANVLSVISGDISNERTVTVSTAHDFLDALGIPR